MAFEHMIEELDEIVNPGDQYGFMSDPNRPAAARVYYLRNFIVNPIANNKTQSVTAYLRDLDFDLAWEGLKISSAVPWAEFLNFVPTITPENYDAVTLLEKWRKFKVAFVQDLTALQQKIQSKPWKWKGLTFGIRHANAIQGLQNLLNAGALTQTLGLNHAHAFDNKEKRLPQDPGIKYVTYDLKSTSVTRGKFRVIVGSIKPTIDPKYTPVYITAEHYEQGSFFRIVSSSLQKPPDVQ